MQRCSRASWMNTRHGSPRLSNPELNDLSRVFGAGWAVRLDQANGSIQPSWVVRAGRMARPKDSGWKSRAEGPCSVSDPNEWVGRAERTVRPGVRLSSLIRSLRHGLGTLLWSRSGILIRIGWFESIG